MHRLSGQVIDAIEDSQAAEAATPTYNNLQNTFSYVDSLLHNN